MVQIDQTVKRILYIRYLSNKPILAIELFARTHLLENKFLMISVDSQFLMKKEHCDMKLKKIYPSNKPNINLLRQISTSNNQQS